MSRVASRPQKRPPASSAAKGAVTASYATLVDDMLAAPSGGSDTMFQALLMLKERCVDAQTAQRLAARLFERGPAWKALLERLASEEHNKFRRNAVGAAVALVMLMLTQPTCDDAMRAFLLNTKYLSLLTAADAPVTSIAQTVLAGCTSTDMIETLLRAQALTSVLRRAVERLTALGASANEQVTAVVMLAANILGRHNAVVRDFVEERLDDLLCRVGIRNVQFLNTPLGVTAQRAVLYCLRFFVRVRHETISFCDSCLSMCAHSIAVLPNESTELCGDVCAVLQRPSTFARQNPNILRNVISLVTRMRSMGRAHHMFRFMRTVLPELDPKLQPTLAEHAFAAAMKLGRSGWLGGNSEPIRTEAVSELFELTLAAAERCPREALEKRISGGVFAVARDHVLKVAGNRESRPTVAAFAKVLGTFSYPRPCPALGRFIVKLSDLVDAKTLSIGDYNASHPSQPPYDPRSTPKHEAALLDHLQRALSRLGALEASEEAARTNLLGGHDAAAATLMTEMKEAHERIAHSPREVEFRRVEDTTARLLHGIREVPLLERRRFRDATQTSFTVRRGYLNDEHGAILSSLQAATRAELESSVVSDLSELRAGHRRIGDRVKRIIRYEREVISSEARWIGVHNDYFRGMLHDAAGYTPLKERLCQLELREEVVRGTGWFSLLQSEVVESMPVAAVCAIAQEEEQAWCSLRARIEQLLTDIGRGVTVDTSQVTNLAWQEEVCRLEIEEELFRSHFHVRWEYESMLLAQEHGGEWFANRDRDAAVDAAAVATIPRLEDTETYYRNVITHRAGRWLAATIGLASLVSEEARQRATLDALVARQVPHRMEMLEVVGRLVVENWQLRRFHHFVLCRSEGLLRAMLCEEEEMERSIFADLALAGAGFDISFITDASLATPRDILQPAWHMDLNPVFSPVRKKRGGSLSPQRFAAAMAT